MKRFLLLCMAGTVCGCGLRKQEHFKADQIVYVVKQRDDTTFYKIVGDADRQGYYKAVRLAKEGRIRSRYLRPYNP